MKFKNIIMYIYVLFLTQGLTNGIWLCCTVKSLHPKEAPFIAVPIICLVALIAMFLSWVQDNWDIHFVG